MSFASGFFRKLLGLGFFGATVGAVLALTAPPAKLSAADACKCDDWGSGNYSCNFAQTQCVSGSETCRTLCS